MSAVIIIGGGLAGLTAAHYLVRAGVRPTILEPRQLGGIIGTDEVAGCTVESGPDSFLASKPAALELIRELGLAAELIETLPQPHRTHIVRDGRFIPLPDGVKLFVPTNLDSLRESGLLSPTGVTQAAGDLNYAPDGDTTHDLSVAELVREHFGEELLQYLAEPLLAGVYGGDPERLSARSVSPDIAKHHANGSLIRGLMTSGGAAKPRFLAFRNGMQTLVDGLVERIGDGAQVIPASATSLHRNGRWQIETTAGSLQAGHVIVTCASYQAAPLLETVDLELATLVRDIPHSDCATMPLVYRRADIPHALDAYGFLVPAVERRTVAACTWLGSKWPNRTPEDKAVLRCFVQGPLAATPDEPLLALVRQDLERLMGITAAPLAYRVQHWLASMPQYVVGHSERLTLIDKRLSHLPGLALTGKSYRGVGMPDVIRDARLCADRITSAQRRA